MKSMHHAFLALGMVILLGACAHPVSISPRIDQLPQAATQNKIDKSVGYFISEQNKALSVVTPAGGGDSVKYNPYGDLESGLRTVLSNTFGKVHAVKDMQDTAFLQANGISWVFTPRITTNSSSRNHFFWPPTDFNVSIDCVASDAAQREIWRATITVNNDPVAVKDAIKDHGLAGRAAMEKALRQLQARILAAPEFRK